MIEDTPLSAHASLRNLSRAMLLRLSVSDQGALPVSFAIKGVAEGKCRGVEEFSASIISLELNSSCFKQHCLCTGHLFSYIWVHRVCRRTKNLGPRKRGISELVPESCCRGTQHKRAFLSSVPTPPSRRPSLGGPVEGATPACMARLCFRHSI